MLNSLHDEVATKLRERIFAGALAPGSFVDEPALCAELAISRTPLREALKVLTAEGLVRHEPRRALGSTAKSVQGMLDCLSGGAFFVAQETGDGCFHDELL